MNSPQRNWKQLSIQLTSLLAVTGVLVLAGQVVPGSSPEAGLASAVGLLLLGGVLCSEVLGLFKLPHLTGYLAAGVAAGPHVLGIIGHQTVSKVTQVNTLALSLIALAGGLELRMSTLREVRKSLSWATLVHTTLGLVLTTGSFFFLRQFIPFAAALSLGAAFAVALLWGVLAISRSPSATLGILSQTRAEGPLTRYALAFVMSSDIVVVLVMAAALVVAKPLLEPGSQISLKAFEVLAHEVYGSISVGTALGFVLAVYLRFVGSNLIILLILLGFGFTAAVSYLHLEPLLTFITAGFVVQNMSRQGDRLLHAIEATGAVVFVVFFATAGAHLDLPLLGKLWPVALALASARALSTYACQFLANRLAQDKQLSFLHSAAPLISQAGLTLGLTVVIEQTFPSLGGPFRSLVVATVALNEVVGPILFKLSLDRTGETGRVALPEEAESSTDLA